MNVVFERIDGGKIRVTTSTWDRAVVILPNQGLEVVIVGKASSLGPGRQADRLLDIDETSLLVRMCDA